MKLKYYLRGTGVGIILTAIVFSIVNPRQELSDDEIIRRATGLGMVMKDEDNPSLDKLINEMKPSAAEAVTTQDSEGTDNVDTEATVTAAPDDNMQPEDLEDIDEKNYEDKLAQHEPENEAVEDLQPEEEIEVEEISFTIERGMSSIAVANLLEKIGLVDDADSFNEYIVAQGKAAVIRTGSFSLPKGSSYQEIMDVITKK